MKVILRDDIKNLGDMGDIVTVATGYARNHLIPKGLAVVADTRNVKALEHEKRNITARAGKIRKEAAGVAEKISAAAVSFTAKTGEGEKLFGSITTMDIAEALKKHGIEVDRRKIDLDEPIRRLGEHTVRVKIHSEEIAELKVTVTAEQ